MTKKRRSIHLTEPQYEALRMLAEQLGITVSELLRRIIDDHLKAQRERL